MWQYLRNQLTFPLRFEKSPPGGSLSPKQLKNGQIQRYLHYWRSSWDKLGTKMTRRNHKNLILWFPGQPCGFRAARNKKHRKFGHFWHFLAVFERFLASSSSETTWSTWKPRKWYSVCSSRHFDTLFSPVPLSIVKWNINQFCLLQWFSARPKDPSCINWMTMIAILQLWTDFWA